MIPCPACKTTKDEHEAENGYGFDWDNIPKMPRPSKRGVRRCRICNGEGVVESYALKTHEQD